METEVRSLIDIEPGTVVEAPNKDVGIFTGLEPNFQFNNEEQVFARVQPVRNNTMAANIGKWPSRRETGWTVVRGKAANQVLDTARMAIKKNPEWAVQPISMTLGGDPEVFVTYRDGSIFPAWEYLRKREKGAHIYWDGFQAEMAVDSGACIEGYCGGVKYWLSEIYRAAAGADTQRKGVQLSPQSVIHVPQHILDSAQEEHITFGCSPSVNIYGDPGIAGPAPRFQTIRTAGGHIHFGLARQSRASLIHIAYALDGLVGVAGVSLAEGLDRPERRITYGRAGEIRFPKHGLEYRVLSNFHILHPALTHLVYELARVTVRLGVSGFYPVLFQGEQEEVRRIINENDVPAARKMIDANKALYMMLLS